jgi:hypothetical protein
MKLGLALAATAFLTCALTTRTGAQESARKGAPNIRVYSENGPDVISASTYVTPAIQVSENAYVFVVEMDLDGQIQVLHPDFPGISVRQLAHRQIRLPNFFAGFNQRGSGGGYYSSASYLGYYDTDAGFVDSRGTVIALASRAPFVLEKIEVNGDWNMATIRRLIERRSPQVAAQALAAYLGAAGEPIGRDYMRFAGGERYASYAYTSYDPCDAYYGYAFGPLRRAQVYSRINYLNSTGQKFRIVAYDFCGLPIIVPVNQNPSSASGFPVIRPPRGRGDTTVFPKARFPGGITPRHPRDAEANAAPQGVFPLPHRSGLPQLGDVTIQAPTSRRGEPRQILEGYRSQPGMAIPEGRAPIERTITPRTVPTAATGAQPVRDYRPEPRVQSPPPSRAPDQPRESAPAPVVHERPPAPSSPPPRTETPRTEPVRSPPPNRK